jgi:hypothetical protein
MNEQDYDYFKSMNEQTIATSNAVLRSLILINGGAAVAVLAFVGSIAGTDTFNVAGKVANLTTPLIWFGWGVAVAVLSMILAYFTHYFTAAYAQAEPPAHKLPGCLKTIFHLLGLLAAFGSLALFLVGMYEVRASVLTALN